MHANHAYMDNKIDSAEPLELVRMLYRGAIEGVTGARGYLRNGDIKSRTEKLAKSAAIVHELMMSLDHLAGGPLSQNLADLYDYVQRLILKANFEQTDAPLAEAERLLTTLLEGWENCRPVVEPWQSASADGERTPVSHSY
jgi:flagellar protein FliS